MSKKALVVIDLQNDITKNYREIIEQVNKAVAWAVLYRNWRKSYELHKSNERKSGNGAYLLRHFQ